MNQNTYLAVNFPEMVEKKINNWMKTAPKEPIKYY